MSDIGVVGWQYHHVGNDVIRLLGAVCDEHAETVDIKEPACVALMGIIMFLLTHCPLPDDEADKAVLDLLKSNVDLLDADQTASGRRSDLSRDGQSMSFFGIPIHESLLLTIRQPHPMSSERTLARIVGGRWFPKIIEQPDPKIYELPDGSFAMHPAVAVQLRAASRQFE